VGIVAYFTYVTIGFRLEDALIYARYVRNFLAGYGLVYNPGELRNAVTSPLYIWLLVVVAAFKGDIPTMANVIGGLCTAGTVYLLIFHLLPREYSAFVGAGMGILFATANLTYLTFGMETPLLIILLTGMLIAYRAQRWALFAVLAGLAGVTRAEAIFIAGPLYLGMWWYTKKLPWRLAGLSLLVMTPFFLFNQIYYGHVFPDTLTAKVIQGRSGLWGHGMIFFGGAKQILTNWYITAPMWYFVVLMCGLPFLYGRQAQPAWWIALFIALLTVFYSALPVPAYHWYLLPYVWAACILVPMGITVAYRLILHRWPAARVGVVVLGCAGFGAMLFTHVLGLMHLPTGPTPSYFRASAWLKQNVSPSSSLGVADVGHFGWYTNLYIVDIVGLVSPKNADYLAQGDLDQWVTEYKPDYILIHTPLFWPTEVGAVHALLRDQYSLQKSFSEPGLVLLGPPQGEPVAGSLLGQPFTYEEDHREGAFTVDDTTMRGLLTSPPRAHASKLELHSQLVFEASLGIAEDVPTPANASGAIFVVAIQSDSEPLKELLRVFVPPGKWEQVYVVIPPLNEASSTLILKTETVKAASASRPIWAVWGEPKVYSRP